MLSMMQGASWVGKVGGDKKPKQGGGILKFIFLIF